MQKRASTSAASTNISSVAIKSSNGVLKALFLAEPAPAIVPHRKKHPARNVEV